MQADLEYLQRHYASLSDEALLEIVREDLTEAGRKCFDAEIQQRGLHVGRAAKRTRYVESETSPDAVDASAMPAWLDEAAEVYSADVLPGSSADVDAANARDILDAAGMPCEVERAGIPAPSPAAPVARERWRVLVPGQMAMQASNILERDLFNQEFEAHWRSYLAGLSDDELDAAAPERVLCGLFDRIDRANRVYEEELERRGKN